MTATLHTTSATTDQTVAPTTSTNASPVAGKLQSAALGVTRIVVSFLFILHGLVGLFGAFGGVDGQGGTIDPLSWPGGWASLIHLVAGALVLVGLFTRPAALLCSGSMAYAYFTVHQPVALFPIPNGGEPAALFAWIFLLVGVLGSGAFALDTLRRR
jgi:putative oxidoreductase